MKRTGPSTATGSDARRCSSFFAWSVALIVLMTGVLHLNTLRRPHLEGDEIVFTFLAERLRGDWLAYTTRGELQGAGARRFIQEAWEQPANRAFPESTRASLLLSAPDQTGFQMPSSYDTDLYDLPMFTHPPLFAYVLAVVRGGLGTQAGLLFPAACHLITIVLVGFLGKRFAGEQVGVTAAALVAVESVTWVMAERVWIDGLLQMLVTAAMAAAYWSSRSGGPWRFAVAGAVLGLAGLAKLVAGLVVPAILVVWLQRERRLTRAELAAFLLPPIALVGAWLVVTKVVLGAFFPVGWPTAWMINRLPWIKHIVDRSPLVYVVGLLLVSPALAYAALAAVSARTNKTLWVPLVWCASFWIGLTVLGVMGMGFQMRHLAAGIPALCLLAAVGVHSVTARWRPVAFALAAYSLVVGVTTALNPGAVDPFPAPLWNYASELAGWDLSKIPGAW